MGWTTGIMVPRAEVKPTVSKLSGSVLSGRGRGKPRGHQVQWAAGGVADRAWQGLGSATTPTTQTQYKQHCWAAKRLLQLTVSWLPPLLTSHGPCPLPACAASRTAATSGATMSSSPPPAALCTGSRASDTTGACGQAAPFSAVRLRACLPACACGSRRLAGRAMRGSPPASMPARPCMWLPAQRCSGTGMPGCRSSAASLLPWASTAWQCWVEWQPHCSARDPTNATRPPPRLLPPHTLVPSHISRRCCETSRCVHSLPAVQVQEGEEAVRGGRRLPDGLFHPPAAHRAARRPDERDSHLGGSAAAARAPRPRVGGEEGEGRGVLGRGGEPDGHACGRVHVCMHVCAEGLGLYPTRITTTTHTYTHMVPAVTSCSTGRMR